MQYGWRMGFEPEGPYFGGSFATVPAPNMTWTGNAECMLHPHIISILRCRSLSTAVQAIKRNCPVGCFEYFESKVTDCIVDANLSTQRDWCEMGREFAYSMRHRVTPLLFYAWFFHAKHFSHDMRGKPRHRCGTKVRAKLARQQGRR